MDLPDEEEDEEEEVGNEMKELMGKFLPEMLKAVDWNELIKVVPVFLKALENQSDDIVAPIGRMARKIYLEKMIPFSAECYEKEFKGLIKRGFTRKEAMTLIINHKMAMNNLIESLPSSGKKKK